jgi:hypothetical protein
MRVKNLLSFIPLLILLSACNIINPTENVPTYVKIDSVILDIDNPTLQGSAAHGITSIWIYYNNSPVGIFDIPCNVPVITEGERGTLSVAPGITLNGLVDLQPQYPFYSFDTITLNSIPGGTVNYTPTTSYTKAAKFPYKEDFEVSNSFVALTPELDNDTSISNTRDKALVFEGGGSGYIQLNTSYSFSESINTTGFPIPRGEAYLEINYKCSVPFEVGLYNTLNTGVDVYEYIMGIKASDTWKKMYVELGTYTGKYPGKDYKVLIKTSLPDGMSSGYVLIDNIKIVTY